MQLFLQKFHTIQYLLNISVCYHYSFKPPVCLTLEIDSLNFNCDLHASLSYLAPISLLDFCEFSVEQYM